MSLPPLAENLMNYFAHGRRFLDDPYFLAGTAVPDWLSVVDRRVRARARLAEPLGRRFGPAVGSRGAGRRPAPSRRRLVPSDAGLCRVELAVHVSHPRTDCPDDTGFRPSFLGHILVEILLDAVLIDDRTPTQLDAYYRSRSIRPGPRSTSGAVRTA